MDCSSRNRKETTAHPQGKQNETEKPRLQKGIWYDSAKLDNRLSQNVQDIQQMHKVYQKYRTDSRRKKLNRGENPERDLPERYATTITICNDGDAT